MVNLERKKCWDFESRELSYTQLLYEIKNERGAWIKFKTSYNFDMYTDDESFFLHFLFSFWHNLLAYLVTLFLIYSNGLIDGVQKKIFYTHQRRILYFFVRSIIL